MTGFHSFIIFAEMRTGSNFLESNLNAITGITCYGEAFNPHFIGTPKAETLLDMSIQTRDADPRVLLDRIRQTPDIAGFRYFHDHDPRIMETVLSDRGCAKIFLTRDPVESYVSWKIACSTGQWKLTDVTRRKGAQAYFDPPEYFERLDRMTTFRRQMLHRLQISGQTAFHLTYDDLRTVEMVNGLAAFLGAPGRLDRLNDHLKVQNPEPLSQKVSNFAEMQAALNGHAAHDVTQIPDLEPNRSAGVPGYVLPPETPLIYLPIRGSTQGRIARWLADLDCVPVDALQRGLSQKDLRHWKRTHKRHRSFTVVEHPLQRAHFAFCRHILGNGPQAYPAVRRTLINRYGMKIPSDPICSPYDRGAHRAAFVQFLMFLKSNLNGQTTIRIDPAWCSQSKMVQGFAGFAAPDLVVRSDELNVVLPDLVRRLGCMNVPKLAAADPETPFDLADIYDDKIEKLAASVYQRDYMMFGFDRWSDAQAACSDSDDVRMV